MPEKNFVRMILHTGTSPSPAPTFHYLFRLLQGTSEFEIKKMPVPLVISVQLPSDQGASLLEVVHYKDVASKDI